MMALGNAKATIDLPEELYLTLSASGLIIERIANKRTIDERDSEKINR